MVFHGILHAASLVSGVLFRTLLLAVPSFSFPPRADQHTRDRRQTPSGGNAGSAASWCSTPWPGQSRRSPAWLHPRSRKGNGGGGGAVELRGRPREHGVHARGSLNRKSEPSHSVNSSPSPTTAYVPCDEYHATRWKPIVPFLVVWQNLFDTNTNTKATARTMHAKANQGPQLHLHIRASFLASKCFVCELSPRHQTIVGRQGHGAHSGSVTRSLNARPQHGFHGPSSRRRCTASRGQRSAHGIGQSGRRRASRG